MDYLAAGGLQWVLPAWTACLLRRSSHFPPLTTDFAMSHKTFVFTALLSGCVVAACAAAQAAAPNPGSPQLDLAKVEAQKGEWSRWRGPNGDGISAEKGLLQEWPDDGPPL